MRLVSDALAPNLRGVLPRRLLSICLLAVLFPRATRADEESFSTTAPSRDSGQASISVVLAVEEPHRAVLAAALLRRRDRLPLELRIENLPNLPATEPPSLVVEESLATARRAYVSADFSLCLASLDRESVVRLIGEGRRSTAARMLFWRIACHVGAGSSAEAERDARSFAVFGLEVPGDAEAVSPEVESAVARAMMASAGLSRRPLRIAADAPGAMVAVDGIPAVCAVPCTVDLMPGDHVVRLEGDGIVAESRLVRVESGGTDVKLVTTPAPPALAADQWKRRYSGTPVVDSAASIRLLARAVRGRRLVLLSAEQQVGAIRLRGVLAVDGLVACREERVVKSGVSSTLDGEAEALIRGLFVQGRILEPAPPFYRQPTFWII
ncbi:MAG: PEGA domain-containing protein, partial [Pseudomonadota bacterium]